MPTVTVNIPETTFVVSAQPNNNFSFYPLIYTGTDPSYQNCIGLLKIALPTLPVSVVDSAKLELSVIVKSGAAPSPIVVNNVTTSFQTTTVTYNTIPAFTATSSGISVSQSDLYARVQIDITGLVNAWLSGTTANNGVALTNSDGTTVVQFATNAIVWEAYFPSLVLTYSLSPVQASALCFSYAQLAHIIEQLITFYPESVMTVYTKGLVSSAVSGTPYQLYKSSVGTYGALFILTDTGVQTAIPLNSIAAIYTGDGTVYNPSITYLNAPVFPAGCDTNLITAYHEYLPVSTEVSINSGAVVQASGAIYKNEYGIIVLSDADGNTPVFIPVLNTTDIVPTFPTRKIFKARGSKVKIKIIKE